MGKEAVVLGCTINLFGFEDEVSGLGVLYDMIKLSNGTIYKVKVNENKAKYE